MQHSILWLITARSGSKGLPGKNILPLGGIPLLAWRISRAYDCGGDVWLSTDSEEYATIGQRYGAVTPFLRPTELSCDKAAVTDVCLHAMKFAESNGNRWDLLGLLQPTSPFVTAQSLRNAVRLLETQPAAMGAVAVRHSHPNTQFIQPESFWLDVLARRLAAMADTRRQAMPREITPCGGFYLTRWDSFIKNPTFYVEKTLAVHLQYPEALDIDSEMDFAFAEFLLASGYVAPLTAKIVLNS